MSLLRKYLTGKNTSKRAKTVYVRGLGGLGNCLFQIAAAIYYCEKYNYNLVLIYSDSLLFGTSNLFGKTKCYRIGTMFVTYDKTIFSKLSFSQSITESYDTIHNDYTSNRITPSNNLLISGYNQNLGLFDTVRNKITQYFNINDPAINKYIAGKYGNVSEGTIICIRRGKDFETVKYPTNDSYLKALDYLRKSNKITGKIYILSDIPINDQFGTECTIVDECDIVQLQFGVSCKNYILSESTFHLWMAYFGTDFGKKQEKTVICYNNSGIASLCLENWIRLDF